MADLGRVWEVYARACELEGDAREAWLAQACGEDAGLRAAVERRLAAHDRPTTTTRAAGAKRLVASAAERARGIPAGTRIGDYVVLEAAAPG